MEGSTLRRKCFERKVLMATKPLFIIPLRK
jgi:hypothetical protein